MPVLFSDRPPIVNAQRGVIRMTLRATSTRGGIIEAGELALTPGAASSMIAELMRAVREFQDAEGCRVVPFATPAATDENEEAG